MRRVSPASVADLLRGYPAVQLATLVEQAPEGPQWIHEVKFDGYRLLGFVAGGEVVLRTRNGKDWTFKFPAIAKGMTELQAEDAVVDMEAVVLDETGKSNFKGLQNALSENAARIGIVAFGFDLLHMDGRSCTALPLLERKRKLKALLQGGPSAIRYSDHVVGSGAEMIGQACSMGLEGIISKQSDAAYVGGRQYSWLKSKCEKRQEFIILGYSAPRSGMRALGALYLGYKKDGKLSYAGKCGTGFSMASARALVEKLQPVDSPLIEREEAADLPGPEWRAIQWVEPSVLCEVSFTEWAGEGRIRHPSFQGLREDKPASEVVKEKPWRNRRST